MDTRLKRGHNLIQNVTVGLDLKFEFKIYIAILPIPMPCSF